MVAYSSNKRFADRIVAGLEPGPLLPGMKRQTIRAPRKRHARSGEELQLYVGMRTLSCRLLGRAICTACVPVTLLLGRQPSAIVGGEDGGLAQIITDAPGLNQFAHYDGFSDWADLCGFWADAHPDLMEFRGVLIRWEPRP